ncbi:MAG: Rab family GTPase [Candidatus Helarchaeota archaeon]
MSQFIAKLIVGGAVGVGKTTLIHRYIEGEFLEGKMTIGSDFRIKKLENNGTNIILQIWDLGGQERFQFIHPDYCRGAEYGILCFAVNDPTSFQDLDTWYSMFIENAPKIKIALLGTKCDLDSQVSRNQIEAYLAKRNFIGYFETSAKNNTNIEEAFQALINQK